MARAARACGAPKRSKPVACVLRAHIMSFLAKTLLLRFPPLREPCPPAPSLSALGDLPFSGAAHRARQRPERGAGGRLPPSRADAGRADGRALRLHGPPRRVGSQRDRAAR